MTNLSNKNVIVAITGGIAAYKIPELVRRLKEQQANVRVVMTDGAKAFIAPLTLQAVSGYPVADSLLDPAAEAAMGHIELAKWADLVLVAPATADAMAKISLGLAGDLLSTLCLATAAPIALAPAMNQQMWRAVITQQHCQSLLARGVMLWGPAQGEQACGDVGPGRMEEPAQLVERVRLFFTPTTPILAGQHWVLTAGPTREAIDPVRYISNHSSGKMGYALAQAAVKLGAKVTLISGPVNIAVPAGVNVISVLSAVEMHQAAMQQAKTADVFIATAAVADYRVAEPASLKLKKQGVQDPLTLKLIENPDIVADVAAMGAGPFTVGFAAETHNVEAFARKKMLNKGLAMIAANDVSDSSIGFNSDENALSVYWPTGDKQLPKASKQQLAEQLVALITDVKNNNRQ